VAGGGKSKTRRKIKGMDTEPSREPEGGREAPGGERGQQSTGDARVDEAIEPLDTLGELPLAEHPPVLEEVHDRLREILGELGER
jgi:hypothetical protein